MDVDKDNARSRRCRYSLWTNSPRRLCVLPGLRAVFAASKSETGPRLENGTKPVQEAAVEMTLEV